MKPQYLVLVVLFGLLGSMFGARLVLQNAQHHHDDEQHASDLFARVIELVEARAA